MSLTLYMQSFVVRDGFCTIDDGKRDQTKIDSQDAKCLIEGRPIGTCVLEPKLFTYFGSGSEFGKVFYADPNPDHTQHRL